MHTAAAEGPRLGRAGSIMAEELHPISMALGRLENGMEHVVEKLAAGEKRMTHMESKIDVLTNRDRDFQTALKVGSKITHFFMATIGGAVVWVLGHASTLFGWVR